MQTYFDQLREVLATPSPLIVLILLVLISGWIGIAAWTAGAAERRNHSPVRFFIHSLLLPGFHLLQLRKEPEAAPEPAVDPYATVVITKTLHFPKGGGTTAAPGQTPAMVEEQAPKAAPAFNGAFFKGVQNQVTPEKPWHISYGGTEIDIVGVREIMAEVAVMVIPVPGTETTRRIRIPFAKITDARPLKS